MKKFLENTFVVSFLLIFFFLTLPFKIICMFWFWEGLYHPNTTRYIESLIDLGESMFGYYNSNRKMSNKTHYYYYVRKDENVKNDYTFALVAQDNGYFNVGMAKCSTKDNFSKATGRLIAEGRAVKKPIVIIPPTKFAVDKLKEWILNNNIIK